MAAIFLRDVMLDDDFEVSLACTRSVVSLLTGIGLRPCQVSRRSEHRYILVGLYQSATEHRSRSLDHYIRAATLNRSREKSIKQTSCSEEPKYFLNPLSLIRRDERLMI